MIQKLLKKRIIGLVVLMTVFVPCISQGQSEKEPVLDGTEGEVFRQPDTAAVQKNKYDHWNEFDGPLTTLKLGLGWMYEYANYSQDETSKEQVGSLQPDFMTRDFRFVMSGKFKFWQKHDLTWKAGIMYDGPTKSWLVRETGLMIKIPEISGHVFIGRTKEGYSLVKVMNGFSIWGFERNMSVDIIPILADGIKYLGYLPKQRIVMNIGAFCDVLSKNQKFSTFELQFVSRIAWLPIYKDALKPVLHIGINYRYGRPNNDSLTVRSRPEANPAPYFIDTKKFQVNNTNSVGGEIYYRGGGIMAGTEFNAHFMNSPSRGNPVFLGGEVFVLYSITGEIRPYLTSPGIFSFLKVKRPVFKGGPGAWEVMLRFSKLDLEDGNITGGAFWRVTPIVMWHLSDMFRINLAYGYGILNKNNTEGTTQFFQARFCLLL
jgi:phosphate-selective porin OprO/OprP